MNEFNYPDHLVFGLDIGTRSIIGTVGYKDKFDQFKVVAQVMKEHDTRAMIDGQIHDISKVSGTISNVKNELEALLGRELKEVCIAAAGRVLKTITVKTDYEFSSETIINDEHIYSLNMLGVEKAYEVVRAEQTDQEEYYCVGYSVIHYYLNDYTISNLEGHKAGKISTELIATFLPDEVINGLYVAVEKAGLLVANLTLEPIAAINVAIPERFRLLNIALIDVGAGTSDICITKDGSIIAYGMIPSAGDEITECIARHYLVDFQTAEKIKLACLRRKSISYKDIIGTSHKLPTSEVIEVVSEAVNMITKDIAERIMELNGGKPVSAVFIVGGGGKLPGFSNHIAEYLNIASERVVLRGAEVLQNVEFLQKEIKKDSTLVTPVGICLNFYEQHNNFIYVTINKERVRLYNNNKLTIVDAAIQVGVPNDALFPKRGKALDFMVNNEKRMTRGELGEAAIVKLNGKIAGINAPIEANDQIEIIESTVGPDATMTVGKLPEYNSTISFVFNDKHIVCPRFVIVGDKLASEYYEIKDHDIIQILDYYTLEQVLEFMDLPYVETIQVNNLPADLQEKVYANFTITYLDGNRELSDQVAIMKTDDKVDKEFVNESKSNQANVIVNGEAVTLTGKESYILVDVLDFYYFDMTVARGSGLTLTINGQASEFTDTLEDNDVVEINWRE